MSAVIEMFPLYKWQLKESTLLQFLSRFSASGGSQLQEFTVENTQRCDSGSRTHWDSQEMAVSSIKELL